jgi:ABC-2 type transport system ATP-binding protein
VAAPPPAIELEGLTKRYGTRRGIDGISLAVPAGTMFGFIGPNGAGKTTTIRILVGLLRPTSGTARLFGRDVSAGAAARAGVAYVPGEVSLYPQMTARDVIGFLGRFYPGDHTRRLAELAAALDLDLAAPAADLSLGNRKKVAIVAALQHRPRLVILDEPTSGLDPVIQARLRELLQAEVAAGTTVLLSSHVLAEVQAMCRTVAILRAGRVLAVEEIAALRSRALRRVHATFAGAVPDELARLPGATAIERDGAALAFLYHGPAPALLSALASAAPIEVRIEEPSLDELFLQYYAPVDGGVVAT